MTETGQILEPQNKKTILVVDDDADILQAVAAMLERDYRVLGAGGGKQALKVSQDCKSEISLLLSDFQMPEMSGIELATQITAQRPEIKVLLMSGYPAGMLVLNEGWHFLPKPFVPSQLRALVDGLVSSDRDSKFAWLRRGPSAPAPHAKLALIRWSF